jgi:cytochrome oxidase Cu insertion factor (SCO1/SenC/PrrC family)
MPRLRAARIWILGPVSQRGQRRTPRDSRKCHFLTGSLAERKRVWRAYGIAVDVERGLIAHNPAVLVIDLKGRLRKVYARDCQS